ncbi:hypothetical protein Ddye_001918 [Dipteronia dyeriana]|uniref:Uncharacterized protein n=1 Tax=Dipteronia dyeriana TaxID=168575 RepID=A0AAD9XPF8_9ROSI|nr:hypothetical protein Ddye_001918 [Dipteronia dyeriana]
MVRRCTSAPVNQHQRSNPWFGGVHVQRQTMSRMSCGGLQRNNDRVGGRREEKRRGEERRGEERSGERNEKNNRHKYLKKKTLKDDEDPLVREDVSSDDEWIVDNDAVGGPSTDVDMSQQVGGKRKRNTNKDKVLQQVDADRRWEDISNQYNSPGTSDDDVDDEVDYPFDPHYTNDSLHD